MKSPSELTVAEMKSALKKKGVVGISSLDRSKTVRKYRYEMSKSKSPAKKSPKRSRKSPKKSPKRSRKSPKRSRSPCREGKVRRYPGSRCTVPGSTAYMTKAELRAKAVNAGAKASSKLGSKTKSQLANLIKRLERCPSGKVFDAVTQLCRDKKVRAVAGDAKINKILKQIETAQKKIAQLNDELEMAKLAKTQAEQRRRLANVQKQELALAASAASVGEKLEDVIEADNQLVVYRGGMNDID